MLEFTKVYVWKGLSHTNQSLSGVQTGNTREVIRQQLKQKGIVVTQLRPTWRLIWGQPKVSLKEIAYFSSQLSYLMRAGLSLLPALQSLLHQYSPTSRMHQIIIHLKYDLENGSTFSYALSQQSQYFPNLYCQLIAVSEQCGNVADQLLTLSQYQKRWIEIKHHVYQALYYPIILVVLSGGILALLIVLVVPQFEDLFQLMGTQLPFLTRVLIQCGHVLHSYGGLIILMLLSSVGLLYFFQLQFPLWKKKVSGLVLQLPWIGKIIQQIMVARFAYTLSVTLKAGLPMLEALMITREVMYYPSYQNAILEVKQSVMVGLPLDQALIVTGCFPPLLAKMVATGQLSGQLEKNLAQLAHLLDTEVNDSIDHMIRLIEPALLLVLGVFIGFVMFALYLPIFELGNVLGFA